MSDENLTQFKMSNGSEVVCEVMEWPSEELGNQMITRNCMTIISYEYSEEERGYAFRPFVNFLDDNRDYVMINTDHIISLSKPSEYLIRQYRVALNDVLAAAKLRNALYEREKQDAFAQIAEAMTSILENKINDKTSDEVKEKEPTNNIINFPGNDTLH